MKDCLVCRQSKDDPEYAEIFGIEMTGAQVTVASNQQKQPGVIKARLSICNECWRDLVARSS